MSTEQNYSPEVTEKLLSAYATQLKNTPNPCTATLATQFARSERSIIAKLVREGVYVAKPKASTKAVTKADLCTKIAEALGIDTLDTLEKASKEQLNELLAAVLKVTKE